MLNERYNANSKLMPIIEALLAKNKDRVPEIYLKLFLSKDPIERLIIPVTYPHTAYSKPN